MAVSHINAAVTELRRLFLVEDLVDSIKFGVLLWCLTYLGSWFNGMTLIIIGELSDRFVFEEVQAVVAVCSVGGALHPSQGLRGEQDADRQEPGDRQNEAGRDHFEVSFGVLSVKLRPHRPDLFCVWEGDGLTVAFSGSRPRFRSGRRRRRRRISRPSIGGGDADPVVVHVLYMRAQA